jgi:protein TonB
MMPQPWLDNLVAWSAQILLAGTFAALLPRLFRLRHARSTLVYGHLVLLLLIALPLIQPWSAPAIPVDPSPGSIALDGSATDPVGLAGEVPANWKEIWIAVLVAGMTLRLCWVLLGLVRLSRYARRAEGLAVLPRAVREAETLVGARAWFAVSSSVRGAATFGFRRPTILVPESFLSLEPEAQLPVACHELLHVARGDWLGGLVDEAARVVFWFSPGLWRLTARMRLAREELVDRQVVRLTGDRNRYIRVLLDAAQPPGREIALVAGLGRSRHLGHRIRSLMTEVPVSCRRLVLSCASMFLLVLAVLGSALALFPMTGQAEIPLVRTMTLAAVQDNDPADGRVEIVVALRSENIVQSAPLPASVVVELTYNVDGAIIDSRVLSGPEAYRERALQVALSRRFETNLVRLQVFVTFRPLPPAPPGQDGQPIRIGGSVAESLRIYYVAPEYPVLARTARQEGLVVLEAGIDTTGNVSALRVVTGAPLLRQAAVDAASQWQYEPFLLNGEAVPVVTTVTVTFTLE